jgi:aspartate racemase
MSREQLMGTIGIVGGMGPMAGLRVARLIVEHTAAERDQDHPNVVLASMPAGIADRSDFLADRVGINPAVGIADSLSRLAAAGVSVAGLACNTAHAEPILRETLSLLANRRITIELLHMVDLTVDEVSHRLGAGSRIGILGTLGTMQADLYGERLRQRGFKTVVLPTRADLIAVHDVVYCPTRGVKANSRRVSGWAIDTLGEAIRRLNSMGADAIILACTELPLVVEQSRSNDCQLLDPSLILARSLLEHVAPGRWVD